MQESEATNSTLHVEMIKGEDGIFHVVGQPGPPGLQGGGAMYTRWGRSFCPTSTGAELVYSGLAGGTGAGTQGGGANYLCMPKYPEYSQELHYRDGHYYAAGVQGAEYENPTKVGTHNLNVPCAVCRVPSRTSVLMIPANYTCPSSWTREYFGYLMAERDDLYRIHFECVDKAMEKVPGSAVDSTASLFYHTEGHCATLPCPPYIDHKELNCVVCTK